VTPAEQAVPLLAADPTPPQGRQVRSAGDRPGGAGNQGFEIRYRRPHLPPADPVRPAGTAKEGGKAARPAAWGGPPGAPVCEIDITPASVGVLSLRFLPALLG
jgi:hypothetical protein